MKKKEYIVSSVIRYHSSDIWKKIILILLTHNIWRFLWHPFVFWGRWYIRKLIKLWPKVGQWQLRALRGFSGHRAWVRIIKKWAPGSYCLELVVKLVQLPGQVLSFSDASESIRKNLIPCELNNWFIQFLSNSPGNSKCLLKCALVRGIGNVTLRNLVNWNFEPVHINDLIQYLILVLSRKLSFTGDLVTYLWINLKLIQLR
jgi:hypothetical protein